MGSFLQRRTGRFSVALVCASLGTLAVAQGIPDRNVNIVGVNPPVADGGPNPHVPDFGLRQQNEAACAMKPANPLQILCAFNDYRGVDDPAIGDAWEGWAWSINGGQTWFSDLLPAHPGDTPNLGLAFAADPVVVAAPGLAMVSYLAANRGKAEIGGLFLQRLFEVNREAGAPWLPEMLPVEVASGNAGQFIDKPFLMLHLAAPGSGNVVVSSTLKNGDPVSQAVPAGRLFLAYTTFLDSKTKLMVAYSDDYGQTWKTTKLSESHAINQSASLAAHGDAVCAVWRRFELRLEPDAILVSCSANRGDKWSKGTAISAEPEFFPFDQATTPATLRVNSHPVITSDGTSFYAFWSSRINDTNPFFARIRYSKSTDGTNWTAPIILEDALLGHQFMPTAAAAGGVVRVAWYDTRNDLFQGVFIQDVLDASNDPPTSVIRHPGDVRVAELLDGIPTPSVQVSRYVEGVPQGATGPAVQLEFNFLNDRLFQQGTVPFHGDYPHIAAPQLRLEGGQWVSNATPSPTEKPIDFLVSFTDNRDVRGNVWEDLSDPTVYTPADEMMAAATESVPTEGNTGSVAALAEGSPPGETETATVADTQRADAEPDPPGVYPFCVPDSDHQDRTRNQNVYSAVVRPGVSIDSPSASKPTGSVQRAHVIWVSNNTSAPVTYAVTIDNQPPDAPVDGRASFLQVPVAPFSLGDGGLLTSIDVAIDPNSTVARTVFITSMIPNPPISISVSDGGGLILGTLTVNPDTETPDIQNPDIQNPDIQNPDIQNAEVHNPDIQNPVISSGDADDVQNPDIQNPDIQNPDIQNADYQNPDIQNPDIQNPDIQNMPLDGSDTENPDVANDSLTDEDREQGYTDITWETTNTGNTTTSFNMDAFVTGSTADIRTQLIAMRTHFTDSARDCVPGRQAHNQIIFNLLDPDLGLFEDNTNAGIFGDGSAYLAPGERVFVTLRVWGDPDFPPDRTGIRVESQSCNSEDKGPGTVACDPPFAQIGDPDGPPEITVPASTAHLEAQNFEGEIGANGDFLVTVIDDVDESVVVTCRSGEDDVTGDDSVLVNYFFEFEVSTDVTCDATDSNGNFADESFTVLVADTTPPEIGFGTDSGDFTFLTCEDMYNVYYQDDALGNEFPNPHVTVFDSIDEAPMLACEPTSGSNEEVFPPPPSATNVTCTASDFRDNAVEDSFQVFVTACIQ